MQKEIKLNNSDLLIMNLVHYFITEKNYNPVILHGINDEIWLENLDNDYKLIRIVSHYIHNEEQLKFDRFKLKRIIKNLKKKTLSLTMPVISIYTSLGDDVKLPDTEENILSVFISKASEIKNGSLLEVFPDIVEKTKHDEKGIDLFVKISDDINKESFNKSKRVEKIFSMKKPLITWSIMIICMFLFILTHIIGKGIVNRESLITLGANATELTKNGDYYRLVTSIFLHIGIIHFICNMYSLYVIGPQVESFYGKIKYIIIFIISGLSASLLSTAFSSNDMITLGTNGVIFGLLGALLYFGYHYRVYLGNVLKSQIIPIIIINLLIGFFLNGINNIVHIGGLIGGIFISKALGVPEKSTTSDKINGIILTIIYIAFLIYLALFK